MPPKKDDDMKDSITPETIFGLSIARWCAVGGVIVTAIGSIALAVWVFSKAHSSLLYELNGIGEKVQEISLKIDGLPTQRDVKDAVMIVVREYNSINTNKIDERDVLLQLNEILDRK
jgi:hypothetical protein